MLRSFCFWALLFPAEYIVVNGKTDQHGPGGQDAGKGIEQGNKEAG